MRAAKIAPAGFACPASDMLGNLTCHGDGLLKLNGVQIHSQADEKEKGMNSKNAAVIHLLQMLQMRQMHCLVVEAWHCR